MGLFFIKIAMGKIFFCILISFFGVCHASETESDWDDFFCLDLPWEKTEGCQIYRASIINLITTPERFHGKRVRVFAYASIDFEDIRLCLMPGAFPTECVGFSFWKGIDGKSHIETDSDAKKFLSRKEELRKEFHGKKVTVEGIFNMKDKEIFQMGEIHDISEIRRY